MSINISKELFLKIVFIFGTVAFLIGVIDPLEGSIVICFGAILITIASYFRKETFFKWFLVSTLLILTGVIALFVVSSFGGLGKDALSPWWGLVIIPYPIGWFFGVVLLVKKLFFTK
ncbi:MAG: hypothetical protein H6Q25_862 [Bacteroidetes bacterium]|nr:hypothetical protein [Bacteroidota bacterium]